MVFFLKETASAAFLVSEAGWVPGCSACQVPLSQRKERHRAGQAGASVSTLQGTVHPISNLNILQDGEASLCCSWNTQHSSVSLHRRSRKYFLTHLLEQYSTQVHVSKMTHPNQNTDTQMCSGTGSDVTQSLDIYVHSVKFKRKCLIIQGTERSFESCWQPPFSTGNQLSTLKQQAGLSLKITGPKRSLKYSKFHLQLSMSGWIVHEIDPPQFLSLRY